MKGIAENIKDGSTVEVELSEEKFEALQLLGEERISESRLQGYIDNLELSADAKALIASIMSSAVRVGELVIQVGKRIVEIVIMIASKFPNTTFGLILGLVVAALVTTIPVIGGTLGSFVAPLAAAFGLANGYMEDIKDQHLAKKIAEATEMFQPLDGEAHVVR
jgi:hypothetical protein